MALRQRGDMTRASHPPTHRFTAELDREWQRLRRHRRSIATVRGWSPDVDPRFADLFASCVDLGDVVSGSHRSPAGNGDQLLGQLVALAADHRLAGRILVQRLLPGVLTASAKYRSMCDDGNPAELAVGALWIAISRYDPVRRSRHVAASLISDTIFAAFRRETRLRSFGDTSREPADFDRLRAVDRQHPLDEFVDVLDDARVAGVPARDLDVLRQLVRCETPRGVAELWDVTPRTVRNHRDRAVLAVREAVAA